MRRRTFLTCAALAAALAASVTAAALASGNTSGFKTEQASMLSTVKPGVEITPLLTVGDVLPSGFRFEAIPDGISVRTRGQGRVDLFVNHETSKVPFPYNATAPTAANGENDFDNAQVSRLILNQHSAGVLNGSFVVPSSSGYQRFCSNYLATEKEGFDREILFTNEESPDYVYRQEASWPPTPGSPEEREAGAQACSDSGPGRVYLPPFSISCSVTARRMSVRRTSSLACRSVRAAMIVPLVRGTLSPSSARMSGVTRAMTASKSAEDQRLVGGMRAPAGEG